MTEPCFRFLDTVSSANEMLPSVRTYPHCWKLFCFYHAEGFNNTENKIYSCVFILMLRLISKTCWNYNERVAPYEATIYTNGWTHNDSTSCEKHHQTFCLTTCGWLPDIPNTCITYPRGYNYSLCICKDCKHFVNLLRGTFHVYLWFHNMDEENSNSEHPITKLSGWNFSIFIPVSTTVNTFVHFIPWKQSFKIPAINTIKNPFSLESRARISLFIWLP